MLDIKFIRENKELVKQNIRNKFQEQKLPLVDEVVELDEKIRSLKLEGDNLRGNRNSTSALIGQLMREGKREEANQTKQKVVEINEKLVTIEKEEEELSKLLREKMLVIPNIIDKSVPIGKDDSENVEIEKFGEPVVPDYEVPYHADILEKMAGLDKDSAGKNSDRYIEFGLETNMSWKKLLRRCLQKERRGSSYSYLQPNRRYSNMGMTVVSRVKDKKVDVVKNVKVCVDTSGSVSPEELNLYLSQIARLTKEFDNVEGELLYWSNAVTDAGPFKNIEDLKKIHVGSTGGTDVRCVFEYLNGETKVDGKYEKHKPKEMAAVIIITDGCFYNNYEDYAKIFGKPSYKVIWMIEGNAMDFKPPFGNVVQITRQGD